jgi:hypothetical protein
MQRPLEFDDALAAVAFLEWFRGCGSRDGSESRCRRECGGT